MDLFDIYQQKQIIDQSTRVRQNTELMFDQRKDAARDLSQIDARIDHLSLVTEAVWKLVMERTDLTEEDLTEAVRELDMADGSVDNRRTKLAASCACGAKVNPKARVCMFCGIDAPERSGFAAV